MTSASTPQPVTLESCATRLSAITEHVFGGIEAIAEGARQAWSSVESAGRPLVRKDVVALKPLVATFLGEHRYATGAGLIIAPSVLADVRRSLEWWESGSRGELRPLELDMDPQSSGYYDYPAYPWFRVPRDSGHRTVFGPYVDYYGADRYILTFTTPIHLGDQFVGVAGTDVAVADFEAEIWPCLRELDGSAALVNGERRVIGSTSPEFGAGTRVKHLSPGNSVIGLALPGIDWHLVRLD